MSQEAWSDCAVLSCTFSSLLFLVGVAFLQEIAPPRAIKEQGRGCQAYPSKKWAIGHWEHEGSPRCAAGTGETSILLLLLYSPLEFGLVALSLLQSPPNLSSLKGSKEKPMQELRHLRRCWKDELLLDIIICSCGFVPSIQARPLGLSLDMGNC